MEGIEKLIEQADPDVEMPAEAPAKKPTGRPRRATKEPPKKPGEKYRFEELAFPNGEMPKPPPLRAPSRDR